MGEPYLDTSVFIHFLTGDDLEKQQRAQRLLEQIERNEHHVTVPLNVIADAVAILSSPKLYHLPHTEIAALLTPLLRLPGFRLRNRRLILQALELYAAHNLDFTNTVIYAAMRHSRSKVIYSFEKSFDVLPEISCQEP